MIIRKDRNIGRATGTLLDPKDRKLGSDVDNLTVITLYRIRGDKSKNWDGNPFWIPNIKLPAEKLYHRVI